MKFIKSLFATKLRITIVVAVLAFGGFFAYRTWGRSEAAVSYQTAPAVKGAFISSVSGTGRVSASSEVELKPKVASDVIWTSAVEGQAVTAGAAIASLDATDALKLVRDAEVNLASAELALAKLQKSADKLALISAQNALAAAQDAKQKAVEDDLARSYEDAFSDVANAFLDLPEILSGLDEILHDNTYNTAQDNLDHLADSIRNFDERVDVYRDSAKTAYEKARSAYDQNFLSYKATSRNSDREAIEKLAKETYETSRLAGDAVKSASNFFDFYVDTADDAGVSEPSGISADQSSLASYTAEINTHVSALLSDTNSVKNSKDAIASADRTIAEKTASLEKLLAGADDLDLKTQMLTVQQRKNALADARAALADYTVRAPFAGVLAKVSVKRGDSVSSNTAIATLITKQQLADVSLNEVDAARIKLSQKAALTFDALPDFQLTGLVAEIDSVGTESSGVVNYNVKIGFDSQDERVKPGMSVSAVIITEVRQESLLVPNSAIKTQGDRTYVQVMEDGQVVNRTVKVESANDTESRVTGDLQEGDAVVTRTVNGETAPARGQAPSLFGAPGGARGSGGPSVRLNR